VITSQDVTVEISTKERYTSTLPLCLTSVALQSSPPKKLLLFDDNDIPIDLRNESLYQNIFKLFDRAGISWEVIFGEKKGQVLNHQKALELAPTRFIYRLDDDHVIEPSTLQGLIDTFNDSKEDSVGAAGGLVLDPKSVVPLPQLASNKIEDIFLGLNKQWFFHTTKEIYPVDHLYSTFLFDKEAAKHGYCLELSKVGHREETIFTSMIKRKGYTLLVDPKAITWHFQAPQGGIRSYSQKELWQHDEEIFARYLRQWNVQPRQLKLVVLDCGLGDHFIFRKILPEVRQKFPSHRLVLAVCYPEVFAESSVELISIAEAQFILGNKIEDLNIYKWCWAKNWTKPLIDAFREMYLSV
jgi:hypothetical protein